MNYENIGSFIMNKRKEKNLTQKQLAEQLGVTDKAVSKWERGLGCPDISIIEDLSKVLEVSILEILKGKRLEKEELQQDKIDNYVLETLDYSKKEMKRKIKSIIIPIFTIIIIGITSFLLFINIYHIFYLNYQYAYNFDNLTVRQMQEDMVSIKGNLEKIKSNQGNFEKEDYMEIVNQLEKEYQRYATLELWNYQGVHYFKNNDLYQSELSNYEFLMIYNLLTKYDTQMERKKLLYTSNALLKGILASNSFQHAFYEYEYQMLSWSEENMISQNKVDIKMLYVSSLIKEFLQVTESVIEVGGIHE